jgi:RNA polymerase sigma factor for flagellar operon FliA
LWSPLTSAVRSLSVIASLVAEPKPTAEAAEALWRRWHDDGDVSARDRLILSHAPLVKYLACRKLRELPPHCDLDDLVSCGLLALVSAVDRFDPRKGATFEQYVWTRISGAILDELRRLDWAPRSLRQAGRAIDRGREDWQASHEAAPTDAELSTGLSITLTDLRDQIDGLSRADLLSLNAMTRATDGALVEVGDTIPASPGLFDPELAALAEERSTVLKEAVADLSRRDQQILTLLHVHQLQSVEVGRILGVSESRISQLVANIRRTLKHRIDGYDEGVEIHADAA